MSRLDFLLYKRAWLVLCIAGLVILAIGEFSHIDLLIEDYYFDHKSMRFPWRESWFASDLMHGYIKNIILNCGYLLYILLLIDFIKPIQKLSDFVRLRLRFVAVASMLIPLAIRAIKQHSILHCPWGIDRYGGTAPFIRLLDSAPLGITHGQCFPAAHATVGIWLAALCIFWLPHRPKAAIRVFIAGLLIGFTMGWVQQMRGAHFLFHTLWTIWLASFIILFMLEITFTFWSKNNNG